MSTTKNLGLFKHDNPATNTTDQFNVDKALNQNWDKLDTAIGTDRERITTLETDNTTNKQDITNIKAKDTEQDKYIAELEAENARLREDLNGLPKGQASGESIDLNDSAEMRCDLKISGNSKQETREGYNLLAVDEQHCNYNASGTSITYLDDGWVEIKNNTEQIQYINYTAPAENIVSGKSYTLKIEFADSNECNVFLQNAPEDYSRTRVGSGNLTNTAINNFIKVLLYLRTSITTKVRLTLVEGTVEKDWEQYGISPTPDYPSEVESCGDNINIFDGEVEEGNIDTSTGQNTAVTNAWRSKNYLNVKDTSVSISVKDLTFSGTVGRLYFYKSDNTYISNILINSLPFTATLPNETAKVRFFILNSVADINAKIKLEKGSTVTPYSPYGQGCINEVICNKNLLPNNATTVTKNGITFTVNEDKSVTINGTATAQTDLPLFGKYNNTSSTFKVNGTITYGLITNNDNVQIHLVKNGTQSLGFTNSSSTLILNEDTNINYVVLRVSTNSTIPNQTFYPMIVKGRELGNYIEHQKQVSTIPTQQPMRSEKDTFVKLNNKWIERHYGVRKILDGTENFTFHNGSTVQFGIVLSGTGVLTDSQEKAPKCISNYFKSVPWSEIGSSGLYYTEDYLISSLIDNNLRIRNRDCSTLEDFKSWLQEQYNAGTPVYVDYILATPIDIECTEEQSTILFDIEQNAKTYDKVTHMYSTDNVSPVIDVTYKKDIETMITNIEQAILSQGGNI